MLKSVREGKKVPLECPDCGCRLNVFSYDSETIVAHHFAGEKDSKDARGHTCNSVGRVWTMPTNKALHLI